MKISDIFKPRSVAQTTESQRGVENAGTSRGQAVANDSDSDSVNISPLSRQLSQISQVLSEDEEQRRAKIAGLKSQIDGGTYSVPSKDVAKSIIDYAKDGETA